MVYYYYLAQLKFGLLGSDSVAQEATFHVIEHPEVFADLVDLYDVCKQEMSVMKKNQKNQKPNAHSIGDIYPLSQ